MRKLVRSQTAKRLKKLDAEVRHVAHEPDADAIHDLRVSIRRLRQELRVFQAWFEPDQVKRIRRRLRRLMERCAAVRNCDVAIEVLREAGAESADTLSGLEQERRHTGEALARTLGRWRRKDRVRGWREHLQVGHADSPKSPLECARKVLPAMMEDLFRAGGEAARPESSHREMHQFRLKAKRVRYTLELFEDVYGEKTKNTMESLKGLQGKLGSINDCATTIEMIRRDRAASVAVRLLAEKRVLEFREYWKKHFGPRERTGWKTVLGAADRAD
jgi:CHAD domain-containing protein